jgi:hypothetical protein
MVSFAMGIGLGVPPPGVFRSKSFIVFTLWVAIVCKILQIKGLLAKYY